MKGMILFLASDSIIELFNRIVINSISVLELIVALFAAFIVGMYIFMIYKITFKATVYSYTFNMSLVIIVLLTTIIILTVSTNNLVITLGMLGTLGVVRFRSSLKDPLDIVYVLWASSAGFAIGAMQYLIAILGSLIIGIILYCLTNIRLYYRTYIIVVNYHKSLDERVNTITSNKKIKVKSKYIKNDNVELTIETTNKYQETIDLFNKVEEINSISLLSFED